MAIDHSVIDSNFKGSLTVIDHTTDNPFAVEGDSSLGVAYIQIVDNSGTPIVSFGGGTQYTDAGTPPTHPIGGTIEWNNGGVWATVGSAAPLPTSLYLGTSAISIGQQTAANSIPVILPSATITTLTPPSNTGYALDSSLSTIDTDLKSNITLHTGTNIIGKVTTDQTTHGTTDLVAADITKVGGASVALGQNTMANSLPVAVASNQAAIALWGHGATGLAVPANAVYHGAQARSSEQAAATSGNLIGLITDLVGKLIVLPYANPENFVSGTTSATTTTSTSLIAAPAAGLRNYITQITVDNTSSTQTYINIQDGSGGTTIYHIPLPANGGATITLPTPLRQPTTATALFFACGAGVTTAYISASGYKGA